MTIITWWVYLMHPAQESLSFSASLRCGSHKITVSIGVNSRGYIPDSAFHFICPALRYLPSSTSIGGGYIGGMRTLTQNSRSVSSATGNNTTYLVTFSLECKRIIPFGNA